MAVNLVNLLCIDTSSHSGGGIALVKDHPEGLIEEVVLESGRSQSEKLVPTISALLQRHRMSVSELSGIAVAIGPGSFTGVRIGIATAQGLSFPHKIPLLGVSSLATLSCNARVLSPLKNRLICPLFDARKGEIYGSVFVLEGQFPKPIVAETYAQPERFLQMIRDYAQNLPSPATFTFLGDGFEVYEKIIREFFTNGIETISRDLLHAKPRNLAILAWEQLMTTPKNPVSPLFPSYLRPVSEEFKSPKS